MLVRSWNLQTSNVALPQWIKSGDNPREIEEKVPAPHHLLVLLTEAIPAGTGPATVDDQKDQNPEPGHGPLHISSSPAILVPLFVPVIGQVPTKQAWLAVH